VHRSISMIPGTRRRLLVVLLLAIGFSSSARAMVGNAADDSIKRFLALDDAQPRYRALRRLEAENGSRKGWIEAVTEYSREAGFTYAITAEGGSSYIRSKVLRAVLDGYEPTTRASRAVGAGIWAVIFIVVYAIAN